MERRFWSLKHLKFPIVIHMKTMGPIIRLVCGLEVEYQIVNWSEYAINWERLLGKKLPALPK